MYTIHAVQYKHNICLKTIIDKLNKCNESQVQAETTTDFSRLTCGSHTQ